MADTKAEHKQAEAALYKLRQAKNKNK